MEDIKKAIQNMINTTPIGEKACIQFKGLPKSIDITMEFVGGWVFTQSIIPGKSFEFTRGEDQYLKSLTITFNDYNGLSIT